MNYNIAVRRTRIKVARWLTSCLLVASVGVVLAPSAQAQDTANSLSGSADQSSQGSAAGSSLFPELGEPAPNTFAPTPTGGTGPAYSVAEEKLSQALSCHGDLTSGPDPMLLIHGTTSTVEATYSWSWNPTLQQAGRSFCTVELPSEGLADIQVSAEYVTYAIRSMHEQARRKIDIVGHSQGGMIARWSTKWWPDTRNMVDDMVGIAPSNNGSEAVKAVCFVLGGCGPALRQQTPNSAFTTALNDGTATFEQIDYSTINTRIDELVVPYTNGFLPEAPNVSNVVLQDYCQAEPVEHFLAIVSNPVYQMVIQAADDEGPLVQPNIDRSDCLKLMPGIDRAYISSSFAMALSQSARAVLFGERSPGEPALAEYTRP